MTTLISLISDQLIPNLLFIKEKEREVDRHILVTTEFMESKGAADRLVRVAGLKPGSWEKVLVVEDSLNDIWQKLEALVLPGRRTSLSREPGWFNKLFGKPDARINRRYLLNLTGGTKMMAIGVSRFFEQFDCESYYAPIGQNAFKQILSSNTDQIHPFSYGLSLADYLECYGYQIKKSGLPLWATEQLAFRFYQYKGWLDYSQAIKELRRWQQANNRRRSYLIPLESDLLKIIDDLKWTTKMAGQLFPDEIQFLISGWWEAFTFFKIKRDLDLPDQNIAVECHIERNKVPNELDIVFVRNNKLFVVECKTGFATNTFNESFNSAMYKMAAIRKDMGLRIPGYLFILDPSLRDRASSEIKEHYTNRANVMDTTLVDRTILDDQSEWKILLDKIR